MPYYGDGLPYYYGSPFANHSSLMTGTPRTFHTPLSRFSPHLSTISESPLATLRRYSPVSVPTRSRRVIDTADIDVSTPRSLSHDGATHRNRLRRDRPTIKIRCQALKDNPALREHHEKHEKSVGELLVEKFLIKDKKQEVDETEKPVQLFHQVSLDKPDDEELQQIKNKITRRFTRRRSSADLQLDPEQLEREVTYAQVQAKVLDSLLAEEQAEIENEVRRGTLIKKGTVGGSRSAPGFFRQIDGESVSQGEEEVGAQRIRKTLKKMKKRKKSIEKPSPPDEDRDTGERRSSTSSDVSVDLQRNEEDRTRSSPRMFKIEASNSVGDFSTVWIGSGPDKSVEQFRESVRIPVPRRNGVRKTDRSSVGEESETEVVLPVKRPYVKDTSRNSVHFTVRTPPDNVKNDPLEQLEGISNGTEAALENNAQKDVKEVSKADLSMKDDSSLKEEKLNKTMKAKKPGSPVAKDLSTTKIPEKVKNGPSEKAGKLIKPQTVTSEKEETKEVTPEILEAKIGPPFSDKVSESTKAEITATENKEEITKPRRVIPWKKEKTPDIVKPKIESPFSDKVSESTKAEITATENKEEITKPRRVIPWKKEKTPDIVKPKIESPFSDKVSESTKAEITLTENKEEVTKPQRVIPWKKEKTPDIVKPKIESPFSDKVSESTKAEITLTENKEEVTKPQRVIPWKKEKTPDIVKPKIESPFSDKVSESTKAEITLTENKEEVTKPQRVIPWKKEKTPDIVKSKIGPPFSDKLSESTKTQTTKKSEASTEKKEELIKPKTVTPRKEERQKKEKNELSINGNVSESTKAETTAATVKKEEARKVAESTNEAFQLKAIEKTSATVDVDPLARENSARALPSSTDGLPKASKINTDENNAVEAPKLSLREAYLAKPTKAERDEDVGYPLPGNKVNKAVTLATASSSPSVVDPSAKPWKQENRSEKITIDYATPALKQVTKTTLLKGPQSATQKTEVSEKAAATSEKVVEDAKGNKVKDLNLDKSPRKPNEEATKFPFKAATRKNELDSFKRSKTEVDKVEQKATSKDSSSSNKKTEQTKAEAKVPWKTKVSKANVPLDRSTSVDPRVDSKEAEDSKALKQSCSVDESSTSKMPAEKPVKPYESLNGENGTLSKSTSSESIDFWGEIRASESPMVAKVAKGFDFTGAKSSETARQVEDPKSAKELDKKKETDSKISVDAPALELSNVPVIEERKSEETAKPSSEERISSEVAKAAKEATESDKGTSSPKKVLKKKKNLSIAIGAAPKDQYSTVKKAPLNRQDSSLSTPSTVTNTPDISVPTSEVSTPVSEISVPLINIVVSTPTRADSQTLEEEEESKTPTNEWPETGLAKISKWSNHSDLSNVDVVDKDITPVPSKSASVKDSPEGSLESSKKKKVVRKKKSSTTKKSSSKVEKETKVSKKSSSKSQESSSLKPPESKPSSKSSPKNTPTQRPMDLIRMFYTTPSALLTATPRDLSKVRRAKIKRKKHHSRTPSVSSDSTGSTTSTATTESTESGSTCTELDDDAEHKRMNSTRSNDSGFDGSPRISNCDMACHKKCEKLTGNLCGLNQKLVAEALQALKRAPSQSSDTHRNSDSSDHFPSGRITPPATNLPRFKKYCVTDFNFLKVLGKGSFGKVLLAELRGTECVYAVKCLKKDVVLEDDDVECTLIERKVLTLATRHPYLCHLFCTFQTESHLFFVMEYLNGGDLMFHIQKSGRFSETRARFYAAEIWSGLNFLHKKGIVYRDLKLDNVLLDFEGHIRIADFGMCKLQIFLDRTADTFCGTPDYMAPEIIKGLKYNQAVDWWSYGVLLYEMLTGQSPFSGCDEDELFWSICNERPFIPRYLSQEAADILICLLEKDSGKRLPGHEIALHSFFQSLPWDRLERRQLDAPFKPALEHTLDTKYFDTAFTAERPRLTPVPEQILTSMDQGVFRGFSYTNPNATD